MKKIIMLICVFCIFGQTRVTAKEVINLDDVKKIENIIMEESELSERNKIENELNDHIWNESNSDGKQSKNILSENNKENNIYDIKKAYCVRLLNNFWLTDYFKGKKLDDNISKDIQWKIPYQRSNGENGLATFAKKGKKYVWIGESLGKEQEKIPASSEVIAKIIAKKGVKPENILKVEDLYSQMYNMTLINIKAKEEGYIIPYAEFPENMQSIDQKYQIVNGKIYERQEFMEEMNRIFDEHYLQQHPEQSSGIHYRQHNVKWVNLTVGIVAIIAGAFMWKLLGRKRRICTD